jgi:hypothetical protein
MRRHCLTITALLLGTALAVAQDRNPDDSPGAGYPNAIPEGTRFVVLLEQRLDSARINPGKGFKAKLGDDLIAPDGSRIPRGSKIKGHISQAEQGLHARLVLSFDLIDTRQGWVRLAATVTGVPGDPEPPPVNKQPAAGAAAVGAGILSERNFRLEKGTQLEVRLDRQLIIPPPPPSNYRWYAPPPLPSA